MKLLNIFYANPDKSFYVRELSRLAGTQLNAVRRELFNLEKVGIVAGVEAPRSEDGEIGHGRARHYALQRGCLLFSELRALLEKIQMMEEREFIEDMKNKGGKIKLLLLTGLFTGEPGAVSDMLLVGRVKPMVVSRLIKKLETATNREVRYTIMDEREFRDRREMGDKFLYNLFEGKNFLAVDEFRLRE